MKSLNENLSEIFDVEPLETNLPTVSDDNFVPAPETSIIDSDSEFARKNIRELIIKGNKAVDELLNIASQSEVPRAFEITSVFLKNLTDMNKDLLEIHKKKKDLVLTKDKSNNELNINQAVVFTGSTHHLMKLLKNSSENPT